jgi:MIP family channel proteins
MNLRVLLSELLGTFILVFFGSLSVVGSNGIGVPPILVVPFGFGFALLAGIVLFGHISGAHFNPAVTLGALIDRRLDVVAAIGYVVAQAVGAVAASLMLLALFGKDVVDLTRNSPASNLDDIQIFGVEAILTTVFIAVILSATARQPTQAVFIIPITLVMIHFVAIPITGASVNPTRSLAPAIVAGNYEHLWAYVAGPLLGGLIGWGIYRLMGDDILGTAPEAGEVDEEDLFEDADPAS